MRTAMWLLACFGTGNLARQAYPDDLLLALAVTFALVAAFWMGSRAKQEAVG